MHKHQRNVELFGALSARISSWDKDARVAVIETEDKSAITHLIITQDVEEVDIHYDAWRSWIHTYFQLIEEGFLTHECIDPTWKSEMDFVEDYKIRTQKSLITYDKDGADNRLAFDTGEKVVVNLDILGVLMTRKFILDLSLSKKPDWRFSRSISNTQLTSYVNLNEQEANGLCDEIIAKLKPLVGDTVINQTIIGIVVSRSVPGAYRVNINLDSLRDILPNRVPYEQVKKDVYAVESSEKVEPSVLRVLHVLQERQKKDAASLVQDSANTYPPK